MSKTVPAVLAALAACGAATAPANAEGLPRAGLYRIEVALEIPNVQGEMPYRVVERCIAQSATDGDFLAIVSSPKIAACPEVYRSLKQGRLELEVACEPVNTGRASGRFELEEAGFSGRIAVTMGGKNMTLTEVQHGSRVGDCPPTQPALPGSS